MTETKQQNWTDYQVGQKVFYVPNYGTPSYLTVSQVGKRWPPWVNFFELSKELRTMKDYTDMFLRGKGIVGKLYECKKAYENEQLTHEKMRLELQDIDWRTIPIEKVKAIHEVLKND